MVYLVASTKTVLLVIDENGKVKYPDHAFMSKVLKKHEDLKIEFESERLAFEKYDYPTEEPEPEESLKAKKIIIKKYIIRLNERLK